jgi:tRNA 2-thiouridine synthesizing protein D
MDELCIAIRSAPYGTLSAAEGVRHLLGMTDAGLTAWAVLMDDGVYVAKRGQDPRDSGWTNLSGALQQALGRRPAGPSGPVRVYVHGPSAQIRALDPSDLIPGVELVDDSQLATLLASSDALLVF